METNASVLALEDVETAPANAIPKAMPMPKLFNLRSAYVHGRPMKPISSIDRFRARRLASRVVVALVGTALGIDDEVAFDREQQLIWLSASPMKT